MNELSKYSNEQLLDEIKRRMVMKNESVDVRNLSPDKHASLILDSVGQNTPRKQFKNSSGDDMNDVMKHCMGILN